MQGLRLARLGFALAASAIPLASAHAIESDAFPRYLENLRAHAIEEGVSPAVVNEALGDVVLDEDVIELDNKQPENKITFSKYISNTISPRRVTMGKQMLAEYHDTLHAISKQYGVQPKYIVALWAIESDYGNNKGGYGVIQSLTTLAYEGRRAEFFTAELVSALKILEAEHLRPLDLVGSWAGAMGDCQFMPSTYLKYAVDGNGDGKRDIWNSPPDVFASIANYLQALGWDKKQSWGKAVIPPPGRLVAQAELKEGQPASQWRQQGFIYANGDKPANSDTMLYAMAPSADEEQVYLVTDNFQALLKWNRSRYFATAVGELADAIGD